MYIEDGFARTTIDQTYFNHEQGRLEGLFYFPLPPDASISRLAMYVHGRLMEGGMAEREHARNVFETIKYRSLDPALLELLVEPLLKGARRLGRYGQGHAGHLDVPDRVVGAQRGRARQRPDALAEAADLTIGNASAHLKALKSARLVETRKDGRYVFYRLSHPAVAVFWVALRDLARQQYAELRDLARRHFADPDDLAPIDRKELAERLRKRDVTLIDVRPADEFAAAHIEGAISIPIRSSSFQIGSRPRSRLRKAGCRSSRWTAPNYSTGNIKYTATLSPRTSGSRRCRRCR